jgi:hypothetical protein
MLMWKFFLLNFSVYYLAQYYLNSNFNLFEANNAYFSFVIYIG